jgi:hypothetical protein
VELESAHATRRDDFADQRGDSQSTVRNGTDRGRRLKLKRYGPYVKSAANLELEDGELNLALAFDWAPRPSGSDERLKISEGDLLA